MHHVLVTKTVETHRWIYTVHAADGDQLDTGTFYHQGCWAPLRLLPFPVRAVLCRDHHEPSPDEVIPYLLPRGWAPVDALPASTPFDVDAEYECPRCGNVARVDADQAGWVRMGKNPAECVGAASCGWTGSVNELHRAEADESDRPEDPPPVEPTIELSG
jgi:hypothetical protein